MALRLKNLSENGSQYKTKTLKQQRLFKKKKLSMIKISIKPLKLNELCHGFLEIITPESKI
jgi:hypothetical protein